MKIADDYVRTWCCYYVLIVKPAKKFYYLTLTSDINDHKAFKLEFKKFKERYFRKTGHTFFGQIEHNGRGKCYHVHLVFIPADESTFDYEQTKKDISAVWTGTRAQLQKPFDVDEGSGSLGMMFYLCKAKKHGRYVKTKFGGQTNFLYCNVGGLTASNILQISKNRVPWVLSLNPCSLPREFFFDTPAKLNGWQGNPATRTS